MYFSDSVMYFMLQVWLSTCEYLKVNIFQISWQVRIFSSWREASEECSEDGKLPTGRPGRAGVDVQADHVRAEHDHLEVDEGGQGGEETQWQFGQVVPLWLYLWVLIMSGEWSTEIIVSCLVLDFLKHWPICIVAYIFGRINVLGIKFNLFKHLGFTYKAKTNNQTCH